MCLYSLKHSKPIEAGGLHTMSGTSIWLAMLITYKRNVQISCHFHHAYTAGMHIINIHRVLKKVYLLQHICPHSSRLNSSRFVITSTQFLKVNIIITLATSTGTTTIKTTDYFQISQLTLQLSRNAWQWAKMYHNDTECAGKLQCQTAGDNIDKVQLYFLFFLLDLFLQLLLIIVGVWEDKGVISQQCSQFSESN